MTILRNEVVEAIRTHVCTRKKHNFPKTLAATNEFQFKVKSFDEVLDTIEKYKDYSNLYCRQYSEWQIKNDLYDKLYIDLDCEKNPKYAYKEMLLVNNCLNNYFYCKPRIYFSGYKGFAIYIDFPEMHTKYNKIAWFVESLRNLLKLKYMDLKVSKDNKRISKMPYTINYGATKGGKKIKMVIPIDPKWSYDKIIKESKAVSFSKDIVIQPSKFVATVIGRMKEPVYKNEYIKGKLVNNKDFMTMFDLSSIKTLVDNASIIGDGRHRILNYLIIPTLIKEKISDEMIHVVCEEFITNSGKNYSNYKGGVKYHISRNRKVGGYEPKSLEDILLENPEIYDKALEKFKIKKLEEKN